MQLTRDARLRALGISHSRFKTPDAVLHGLVASQAQDFHTAKWALGMRARGSTVADVEALYDSGRILRTHVMRPTWHFVLDDDIRWLVELTAPRVRTANASMTRSLGLDVRTLTRTTDAIVRALAGGRHLTREALREVVERAGVEAGTGQRLAYIVFAAEVEALICSGRMSGKQTTYALLDERAPRARRLGREEALAELARRYVASRAPCTAQDFAKWSGLTVAEAKRGFAAVDRADGHDTPLPRRSKSAAWERAPVAHLLSVYDEYVSSYKDRSAIGDSRDAPKLVGLGNALQFVLILDGFLSGTWRRELGRTEVDIAVAPFRRFTAAERRAVDAAAARYAAFFGLAVGQLSWKP